MLRYRDDTRQLVNVEINLQPQAGFGSTKVAFVAALELHNRTGGL